MSYNVCIHSCKLRNPHRLYLFAEYSQLVNMPSWPHILSKARDEGRSRNGHRRGLRVTTGIAGRSHSCPRIYASNTHLDPGSGFYLVLKASGSGDCRSIQYVLQFTPLQLWWLSHAFPPPARAAGLASDPSGISDKACESNGVLSSVSRALTRPRVRLDAPKQNSYFDDITVRFI